MVFAFLVLSALQDLGELKKELKAEIRAADARDARAVVRAIIDADSAEAVDALLWGVGITKKTGADLIKKRKGLLSDQRKAQEILDEKRDIYQKAYNEYRKDILDADKKQAAVDAKAVYREASQVEDRAAGAIRRNDQQQRNVELIRNMLLSATGEFEEDAAIDALIRRLKEAKDWAVRAGIAAGLGRVEKPEARTALLEALRSDTEATVRLAAADSLADRADADEVVLGAFEKALDDPAWQVVYAALQGLVRLGAIEVIERLIGMMGEIDGRLRFDVHDALVALTGVDKGIQPDAWESWFEQNRDAILSGQYKPREDEAVGGQGRMTRFYGIPVKSKRVIFVLDGSGSMARPAEWIPEIQSGEGLPKELRKPKGNLKIDIARWQLKKVLYLLPENSKFNIIFYNETFEVFKPNIRKLNNRTRKAAYAWIDEFKPDGNTNVFDSLEKAMEFATDEDGRIDPKGVDTIYLLSDGLPNRGRYTRTDDIVREITKMNDRLKMSINTILIGGGVGGGVMRINGRVVRGGGAAEEFMKELAEKNNGVFVQTGNKPKPKKD